MFDSVYLVQPLDREIVCYLENHLSSFIGKHGVGGSAFFCLFLFATSELLANYLPFLSLLDGLN